METDYIDKTFRPDLLNSFLSKREMEWLKKWGMDTVGVPVPTPQRKKAAVWPGSAGSTGEAPVLVVLTEPLTGVKRTHNIWYIGVLAIQEVSGQPLLTDYLYAAEFGPQSLLPALELLVHFAPLDRYSDSNNE